MTSSVNTISNPNDPFCDPPPTDTVQSLKWGPTPQHLLCAAGWDSKASIWEITPDGKCAPKLQTTAPEPLLSVSWLTDASNVFLGCCDSQIRRWDINSSQLSPIGQHRGPVSEVLWCQEFGMVISGSWDQTVAFWDGRQ